MFSYVNQKWTWNTNLDKDPGQHLVLAVASEEKSQSDRGNPNLCSHGKIIHLEYSRYLKMIGN